MDSSSEAPQDAKNLLHVNFFSQRTLDYKIEVLRCFRDDSSVESDLTRFCGGRFHCFAAIELYARWLLGPWRSLGKTTPKKAGPILGNYPYTLNPILYFLETLNP